MFPADRFSEELERHYGSDQTLDESVYDFAHKGFGPFVTFLVVTVIMFLLVITPTGILNAIHEAGLVAAVSTGTIFTVVLMTATVVTGLRACQYLIPVCERLDELNSPRKQLTSGS